MTTGIFIVSYAPDIPFLEVCLKSIEKHCSGFQEVVVAFPVMHQPLLKPMRTSARFVFDNRNPSNPFNSHQSVKCHADKYLESDYILHLDSDCMLIKPTKPEDYFEDGKPVLLCHPFEDLQKHSPQCMYYQDVVEKALGWKPEMETMRRHPAVHPRWLYSKVREHISNHVGVPFEHYVLSCSGEGALGFTEFPTLGAYAHRFHHDDYHWIDTSKNTSQVHHSDDHLKQFWSRKGMTDDIKKEVEKYMA